VERKVRKVRVKIGERGQEEVEVGLRRLGGWWRRDTHTINVGMALVQVREEKRCI